MLTGIFQLPAQFYATILHRSPITSGKLAFSCPIWGMSYCDFLMNNLLKFWEFSHLTFTSHGIILSSSPHPDLKWGSLSHLWFIYCLKVRMKENLSGSNPFHGVLPSSPAPQRHNYPLKSPLLPNSISTLILAVKMAYHLETLWGGGPANVPVNGGIVCLGCCLILSHHTNLPGRDVKSTGCCHEANIEILTVKADWFDAEWGQMEVDKIGEKGLHATGGK